MAAVATRTEPSPGTDMPKGADWAPRYVESANAPFAVRCTTAVSALPPLKHGCGADAVGTNPARVPVDRYTSPVALTSNSIGSNTG